MEGCQTPVGFGGKRVKRAVHYGHMSRGEEGRCARLRKSKREQKNRSWFAQTRTDRTSKSEKNEEKSRKKRESPPLNGYGRKTGLNYWDRLLQEAGPKGTHGRETTSPRPKARGRTEMGSLSTSWGKDGAEPLARGVKNRFGGSNEAEHWENFWGAILKEGEKKERGARQNEDGDAMPSCGTRQEWK